MRNGKDLTPEIQGLIIPGGESTTMVHFLAKNGFLEELKNWITPEKAVWGTCAGLILLADQIKSEDTKIGGLPIKVSRNSYGRQRESFEMEIKFLDDQKSFNGIFIRAPKIIDILDKAKIQILASKSENGEIVGVQKENLMATSFHPELTDDLRFHAHFLSLIN